MTNIVFSPALQAPITLAPPSASIVSASDPATIIAKVSPVPGVGQISLVSAAVKMALAMSTNAGTVSFGSTASSVVSGLVTARIPTTGVVSTAGVAPTVAVASGAPVLSFPRIMLCGVGGDQGFGRTSGYPWTTAANGTAANTAIQIMGAYDIVVIGGTFEGWDSNGAYDRENLTLALAKSSTTYAITKNNNRATLTFYYEIMNVTVSGNPYAQWQSLVTANNWFLYPLPAGGGTATRFINYSAAWPGTIGNAGPGASICGSNYGTTSSGSPTGPQGPARTFGNYASIKLLMRGYAGDSRFSFNAQMGSPSAAGIFLDECFVALDGDASTGSASLDGVTIAPGSQQGGGFPGLDTVQPVMARGNRNMMDQAQTMLSLVNPGKTYYNFANFGHYANKYQFGTATLTCGLENTLHGGLLENVYGAGASSWECFQQGNFAAPSTPYPSGALNALTNYYQGMDFCLSPKLVGVGVKLPAVDGSQTAAWPVGAGTTLTTVTAGSALEYQLMRCSLCMTLLDDGYWAPGVTGYDWSKVRWYDEMGDDSLTQVNVKRGYLGTPLETRPNAPFWAQGPLGVWKRDFTGGRAIWNPRGNGSQTVALGAFYLRLRGTQQPTINNGAYVTSVTVGDGDGAIVVGPQIAAPLTITTASPLTAATQSVAYSNTLSVSGGFAPYTWSLTSASPNTGSWFKLSAAGVYSGTPGSAETESIVVKVTDAAGQTASKTLSLVVQAAGLPIIFSDDFSSGNLSHVDPSGVKWASSGNTTVNSQNPYPGKSFSLVYTFSGNAVGGQTTAEQRFDLGAGNKWKELQFDYDMYFPNGTEGFGSAAYTVRANGTSTNNKFLRVWAGNRTDGNDGYNTFFVKWGASLDRSSTGAARIYGEYGKNQGGVGEFGSGSGPDAGGADPFVATSDLGTWIHVTVHIKAATAANNDGVLTISKNGIVKTNATNLPQYPSGGDAQNYCDFGYILGFADSGFTNTTKVYIANVVIRGQ